MKRIASFLLLSLSFLSLISCNTKKLPSKTLTIIKQDNTKITVDAELAIKPEDRNFGFMERKNIPDGTGMLFVWNSDQILSFWMKNTPHPLSIAYIDSKGKIRDIFDMTPYSLSPIHSTCSVRYALEVPQGWYKKNGITVGDTIQIPEL